MNQFPLTLKEIIEGGMAKRSAAMHSNGSTLTPMNRRSRLLRFAPFALSCIPTIFFLTGCTENSTTLQNIALDFARQALAAFVL
ncbi:MAG: hypothetical protein HY287_01950 [Planctomycetes bacterium]|nr:hypothetical protein [Planctomycetota bacterium]